jgi:hypothetical protein
MPQCEIILHATRKFATWCTESQKLLHDTADRFGATSGLAVSAMAKCFQLPANCEANEQLNRSATGARPPRRSNASLVLAEDLRQALRRSAPCRPPGQQGIHHG